MLTIQPGLLFSKNAVRFARLAGLTDDDIAAHIDEIESGETTPIALCEIRSPVVRAAGSSSAALMLARQYVLSLCRIAGVTLTGQLRIAQ